MFALLQMTADMFVKEFEKHILQSLKFTLYGSLQLDKDVRTISQYFTDLAPSEQVLVVKDKFKRLNHIAALLSVEQMEEVQEIWESEFKSGFSFSTGLVKKILLLRTDIGHEDLKHLDLH